MKSEKPLSGDEQGSFSTKLAKFRKNLKDKGGINTLNVSEESAIRKFEKGANHSKL